MIKININNKIYIIHTYYIDPPWLENLPEEPYNDGYKAIFKDFNARVVRTLGRIPKEFHYIIKKANIDFSSVFEIIIFNTEQDYMFFCLKYY